MPESTRRDGGRTRRKGPSARTIISVLVVAIVAAGIVLFVYRLIGSREAVVPNVRLVALEQAERDLLSAGLSLGVVTEVATRGPAPGRVVEQSIAAGEVVEQGTAVDVTVAAGLVVPGVIGLDESEARAAIAAVRMKSQVFPVFSDEIAVGAVVDQLPHEGAAARSNAVLFVSLGPGEGTGIPDVSGMTRSQATSVLSRRGLRPVWISGNAQENPGTVMDQAPAPTMQVPEGSYVGVMINVTQE